MPQLQHWKEESKNFLAKSMNTERKYWRHHKMLKQRYQKNKTDTEDMIANLKTLEEQIKDQITKKPPGFRCFIRFKRGKKR